MRTLTSALISSFETHLLNEEKAIATVRKYVRDVRAFASWLSSDQFDKTTVLAYKAYLMEKYAPASVNAGISSLNSFFSFCEWYELRVKSLKIQRRMFSETERELSVNEYERLLHAASVRKDLRLWLIMQAICSTGIRVSELRYITVESTRSGRAEIRCKGKHRVVFLPTELCGLLRRYVKAQSIKKGPVFVTRNGKPLDRSNIWADMKKLCRVARGEGIPP